MVEVIVNLVMLGIVGLALWKGGLAERWGVAIYGLSWAATLLLSAVLDHYSSVYLYAVFIADFVIAIGFLVIALRFSNLWLAVCMIAQGFSSAAHAYRLDDSEIPIMVQGIPVWRAVINLMSLVVIAALLLGTLTSWRRRIVRARGGKAKPRANLWSPPRHPPVAEA